MNEQTEIMATLEELRKTRFPAIAQELVQQIVKVQGDFLDHPAESKDRIKAAIEAALLGSDAHAKT